MLLIMGHSVKGNSDHASIRQAADNTNHTVTGKHEKAKPGTNSLFKTSLTLPNGAVVKPQHPVQWKDLSIQVIVTSLPSANSSKERYKAIIGNHSTLISHEKVNTSAGKAMRVLSKRTGPAASKSKNQDYEYWLIRYGAQYTYAVKATVNGNLQKAKNEMTLLMKHWKVPS